MMTSSRRSLLALCPIFAASVTNAETVITKIRTVSVEELNVIMTTELQIAIYSLH